MGEKINEPSELEPKLNQSFFSFIEEVGERSPRSLKNFYVTGVALLTFITGAAQGSGQPVAHAAGDAGTSLLQELFQHNS